MKGRENMSKKTLLVAAVLIPFGCATLASAAVMETGSSRLIRTDAIGGGLNQDGVFTNMGPMILGDWMDSLVSASDDGGSQNAGRGEASQTSSVTAGSYSGTFDTLAFASSDGIDITNGYGESMLTIDFTLTTATDFMTSGTVSGTRVGSVTTSLAEIMITSNGGGSASQVIASETNGSTPFSVSGTLLPGNYTLSIRALSIADQAFEFSPDSETATASADFSFTFVPAPSAMGVFGLAGIAALRRRR